MCGIVGYIGQQRATPILLEGLRQLEYRGYDSAGLALLDGDEIKLKKSTGNLNNLVLEIQKSPLGGTAGIGHTRWATHGKSVVENAHPHTDCSKDIAVVHNGIIENYRVLREKLTKEGHRFSSETDTEVLAHLIEKCFDGDLEKAVRRALLDVQGNYALAVISRKDPQKIIGVRSGSPLIVGLGKDEYFLASDIPALLKFTQEEIILGDGEVVALTRKGVRISGLKSGRSLLKTVHRINWDIVQAEKEGYPHFMLKEIHEQPNAVRNALSCYIQTFGGTVNLPDVPASVFNGIERVRIIACGSSYHAALLGKYYIEKLSRTPVEVDIASEYRYLDPIIDHKTLTVAITQSGETADTLSAMKESERKGSPVIAICNVVGSSASRQADGVIYMQAGPEIGVASTKTFTAQILCLILLALSMGQERKILSRTKTESLIKALSTLPDLMTVILVRSGEIKKWAERYSNKRDFLFLGRGCSYPIALEGALKLKEISYIHAEGYPAGEMKYGPIALIDREMPVVILAPEGELHQKVMSNLEEVKSRGGIILALATEGDKEIQKLSDQVFYIPPVDELILPILMTIPLQLLSYYIAVRRRCNVDQPRNLAKSVTVE